MNIVKKLCFLISLLTLVFCGVEGRIQLVGFDNESEIDFNQSFRSGVPFQSILQENGSVLIDTEGAEIESVQGDYKIILEDAGHSGFHRPHWKFNVWLESSKGFDFLNKNRILYAVIFYDGDGEVKLRIDQQGKLHVEGGYDVKDILYPWAVGTIGRGNPYHQIRGTQVDQNGIKYFDYDGFLGLPYNPCLPDGCNSFDNQRHF